MAAGPAGQVDLPMQKGWMMSNRMQPAPGRSRRIAVASALTLAAVAAASVALAQTGGQDPGRQDAGGLGSAEQGSTGPIRAGAVLPPLDDDAGLVHVHGLGVDPGDGVLYAATHSGLFRVPADGPARRIANRAQDTMGFSVVGPGTFLGSGHPDIREDDLRPPLLGLIESTDRGQSWQPLSLRGQADFHSLEAAHGSIYGYDATSQTFMVSTDRRDWDRRSTLPMADFAVDPETADTVLATTANGVLRSDDGGRQWAPIAGAPTLVVLAWAAPGQLYGVTPDGTVQRSEDGGNSWRERGSVGAPPEAITVDVRDGVERLYVAAAGVGIQVSDDRGQTFTTRYAD